MHAESQSLGRIFGRDHRLLVPMFQRPYVWRAEGQWEPLWEDVRNVTDRLASATEVDEVRPHFLGAIVLDQVRQPMGRLDSRLVIDGQQRLTTVQLLLEACADICHEKGWERYHRAFVKLTRNEDPLSDDPDDVYKVWPTNVDRPAFRGVMETTSADALRARLKAEAVGDGPIAQAFLFFTAAIQDWLPADDTAAAFQIGHLYTALKEKIRLVVIDLDHSDDPQLIFETLNARGTPLLPADLIKNYLFHRAQQGDVSVETLHEKYWKHFDDAGPYWRAEVAAGRVKRSRIDLFLQHYLAMQTGDEVQVGHLYAAFRAHVSGNGSKVEEHLKSLASFSNTFRRFDEISPTTRQGMFFRRIEDLQITTAHPLLLHLFSLNLSPPDLNAVLTDIESFLVRRLVCHLTTKNYNRLFLDTLKAIRTEAGDVPAALRQYLLAGSGDSVRWPSDAEFREAWLELPIFRTQARRRTRMLLEALEIASRGPKTELLPVQRNLTIEHLLPQEWQPNWPLSIPSDQPRVERDRLLHTMGNLTLLTRSLNPAVSNGPWSGKRTEIRNHSLLMLNKAVWELPDWDEAAIRRRGLDLFALALSIWPRPAESEHQPTMSYAREGERLLDAAAAEPTREDPGQRVCPIPGCSRVFKKSLMGWDSHVSSPKKHPWWQPHVVGRAERRTLFLKEYPDFVPAAAGEALLDRGYWERRADPRSLTVVDECGRFLEGAGFTVRWIYARHYIAFAGRKRTFVWVRPQRTARYCHVSIRTEPSSRREHQRRLEEAGLRMTVNEKGNPSIDLTTEDVSTHSELLLEVFESAIQRADR